MAKEEKEKKAKEVKETKEVEVKEEHECTCGKDCKCKKGRVGRVFFVVGLVIVLCAVFFAVGMVSGAKFIYDDDMVEEVDKGDETVEEIQIGDTYKVELFDENSPLYIDLTLTSEKIDDFVSSTDILADGEYRKALLESNYYLDE